MIKNLPRFFPLSALDTFDFGDTDAQQDPLLSECPVPTASITEFLNDKKDIVLGYRGTGKSAMVRLIAEGKLRFPPVDGCSPIVLALTEEFSFQLISGIIQRNGQARENKLMSRVVWELLIIYRALQEVREKHGDIARSIKTHLDELDVLLGTAPRRQSFIQVLLSTRKKIGVKLDSTLPTVVDMYAGIEPAPPVQTPVEPITLRLIEYKRDLNRILHDHKLTLYILFDRLDDFVAHEDYDTQRLLLHGLLATQLDYRQKYPRVRIKAFIRTDLFRKLDLSDFGPDKIYHRTVTLTWSPAEIKHFLANRIAFNLMRALDLSSLQISLDEDEFQVSRRELADLHENKASVANSRVFSPGFWRGLVWLTKFNKRKRREYEARSRNMSEVINEKIITAIFPTEVLHCRLNGTHTKMGLFEYFETHFQFGHGETTPRAMLAFLTRLLIGVRAYYQANPDIHSIAKNHSGEFPLLLKRLLMDAYAEHRKDAWEVQYQWATPWKPLMGTAQRISTKASFSFDDFLMAAQVANTEAKQFLAFCAHTGLVECLNEREKPESRVYRFPILFQTCPQETLMAKEQGRA